jgi:predicted transcriptional regulator
MASEVLKLTAQIVMSHASMSELSPDELVDEIKEVYNILSSLEGGGGLEDQGTEKSGEAGVVKKPPVPLKEIVKAKYVVCLECGKKMKKIGRAHV